MSCKHETSSTRLVDRREFFGIGLRTAAVLSALPAASAILAGCGSGEKSAPVAASTPSEPPAKAAQAAPPAPAQPQKVAQTDPPAAAGEDKLVTEIPAIAATVSALQYVNESTTPDQHCSNCQLFTAGTGGRGKCQLFPQGLVSETGHCASWVAKVPQA